MSGSGPARRGLLPIAAIALGLTAIATVATHAQHVGAGYELDREVRRTERLQREYDRLMSECAEASAPGRVLERAEQLDLQLAVPGDGRDATIDLDARLRRGAPSEETRYDDRRRGHEAVQRPGGAR